MNRLSIEPSSGDNRSRLCIMNNEGGWECTTANSIPVNFLTHNPSTQSYHKVVNTNTHLNSSVSFMSAIFSFPTFCMRRIWLFDGGSVRYHGENVKYSIADRSSNGATAYKHAMASLKFGLCWLKRTAMNSGKMNDCSL